MQLLQAFDATLVTPSQGSGQLPVGRHPVIIVSSEVKGNKNNDGGYLQLDLKITDGPAMGTTGAYRLNLYHSNPKTVEIANQQLSAVCHVTGVFKVTDSSQLHNIPFVVDVEPQKNDPTYTEVKRVFDANGNEPGRAGAGQQSAAPQQQQQSNGGWGNQGGGQPQQQQNNGAASGWGGQPQGQQDQSQNNQGSGQSSWGGQAQDNGQNQQQGQGQGGWGQQQNNTGPNGQGGMSQGGWGGQQQTNQGGQPQGNGGGWGGQASAGGAPTNNAPWSK